MINEQHQYFYTNYEFKELILFGDNDHIVKMLKLFCWNVDVGNIDANFLKLKLKSLLWVENN